MKVTVGRRDFGSLWASVSKHRYSISSRTSVEVGLFVNTCEMPPKSCPSVSLKIKFMCAYTHTYRLVNSHVFIWTVHKQVLLHVIESMHE